MCDGDDRTRAKTGSAGRTHLILATICAMEIQHLSSNGKLFSFLFMDFFEAYSSHSTLFLEDNLPVNKVHRASILIDAIAASNRKNFTQEVQK